MDRTIHFGDDAADARYRIQDTSSTGGDLVLAEDLDGGTVLLEYDYSASEWVSRGPVNLDGNDITNAGSITADTLEATDSITDPEGNTVTSLSNPVQVTEEAATFNEADVNIDGTNVGVLPEGSIGFIDFLVEGFEDQDININEFGFNAWDNSSPLTIVDSPALANNYSLQFQADGGTQATTTATKSDSSPSNLSFIAQVDNVPDRYADIIIQNSEGNSVIEITFGSSSNGLQVNGSQVLSSYSADTEYKFNITFRWSSNTFDLSINGTEEVTNGSFSTSSTYWGGLKLDTKQLDSSFAHNLYLDNIKSVKSTKEKSGNALVYWDSGSPEDINSWDIATLQKSLDNETVTVDVEDSNQNLVKSDISPNTDISDIDNTTDVRLRVNISRSDTSNSPTLDYAARRFTR